MVNRVKWLFATWDVDEMVADGDFHGVIRGRKEMRRFFDEDYPYLVQEMRCHATNHIVDGDGDGYRTPDDPAAELGNDKVLQSEDGLPGICIFADVDRLRRVEGSWKILERYVGGSMTKCRLADGRDLARGAGALHAAPATLSRSAEPAMTLNLETAVHHGYIAPLMATGRIPNRNEVATQLALPIETIERALRSLARNHGIVLHKHVCEPWVIHPFSASLTATWVESGDRGWWATCMWCACGVATLVGGKAIIHTRLGGEVEDIDIHVDKGRIRESDLWVHFAVPPRAAWDCVHHFCATVLPFRSPADALAWSERHGIAQGAVAPVGQIMDLGRAWYARHADPDWRKWTVREAAEIFRKVDLTGDFWQIPETEGGF